MSAVEFPEIAGAPFEQRPDVEPELELVPEPAPLPGGDVVEWTPERAAALMRGFGLVLHTVDPASQLDGGDELWRATAMEAQEIGAPLARILARYEPAKRLAGVVDEAELGAALASYTRRHLAVRGRLVMAAEEESGQIFGGDE